MMINHHFRVEIKAHNFNSSTVNKRFLPPVISISPVTFLSPTGLGQELGIVLDFRTNTITIDESILPMRNIDNLSQKSKIEKAWSLNNSA